MSVVVVTQAQRRIHYLYCEFSAIAKNPIEGVYVTPSSSNPLVWFGVLIVRCGVFSGGIFRFVLTIPDDFPENTEVPVVHFEDNIFHPMVNQKSNKVDLSRTFPSGWQRDRNHIYQVLSAIQGIFFSCHCEPNQATNPEAAILLKENKKKFFELAQDAVRRSRTQVYAPPSSDDRNAIRFIPWNNEEMEPFRLYLLDKSDLPSSIVSPSLNNNSSLTPITMDSSISSSKTSSTTTSQTMPSTFWLFLRFLGASRPKTGYSWIDSEHSRYMCDVGIYPHIPTHMSKTTIPRHEEACGGQDSENDLIDTPAKNDVSPIISTVIEDGAGDLDCE